MLALRVEGSTLPVPLNSGATETHLAGYIKVIGGTGTFAEATGIGTVVGTRGFLSQAHCLNFTR